LYGGGPVKTRCRWPGTTTGLSKIRDPGLQGQGCRQNVGLIEEQYVGGLRKRDGGPRMSAAMDVRPCPAIELGTNRDCDEQHPLAPQTVPLPGNQGHVGRLGHRRYSQTSSNARAPR
jgi:hypothetical protein